MLELGRRPLVMGILNVTPDSFAEDRLLDPREAIARALAIEAEGADLIDIGGESTRPGEPPVRLEEELGRVVPVVAAVSRAVGLPVFHAARIPDIAHLLADPYLLPRVQSKGALEHMRIKA